MSSHKKINPFSKQNNDTGFAGNTNDVGGRFINKDGSYNLVKEGMPFGKRFSMFHDMLNLPLWKFIVVIFLFFLAINFIFTLIYLLIGPQQLDGLTSGSMLEKNQGNILFQHPNVYYRWLWPCKPRWRWRQYCCRH